MIAVANAFAWLAWVLSLNGRRLEREYMASTWVRLRKSWVRRDGTTAYACERPKAV